jgi:uncharacterized protein YdeI (YjbR/CyaY-like superfamily)
MPILKYAFFMHLNLFHAKVKRHPPSALVDSSGRSSRISCGTLRAMHAPSPTLFKTAKAFEAWLKKNHASCDGLWLKIAKRGASEPSVSYPEAVEIALCWGWIDSQKKSLDDQHFLQRFTPRRARSIWSKIDIDKAAALIEAGRMQAPGYAQVEAAKADGRWAQAYDGARTSAVPEDFLAALDAEPSAKAFFATINAANRYAVLWRIQTAVKAETRARRIAQLVGMLARGETIHITRRSDKA